MSASGDRIELEHPTQSHAAAFGRVAHTVENTGDVIDPRDGKRIAMREYLNGCKLAGRRPNMEHATALFGSINRQRQP